jgi:hypothetical protein
MTLKRRNVGVLTAAAVITLGLAMATACTPDAKPAVAPTQQQQPAKSVLVIPTEMPEYLQAAEMANEGTHQLGSAGARPTLVQRDSVVQSMIIRDEAEREWKAGRYRLVSYCFGEGTLYATLRIGTTMNSTQIRCDTKGTMTTIDVKTVAVSSGMAVIIAPVGTTAAAVSYHMETF